MKKRITKRVLAIVIITGGLVLWLSQEKLDADHSEIRQQYLSSEVYKEVADSSINLLIQDVIKELKLPSLSVAVSLNGELIWACTFGYSDIKENSHPDLSTKYRAGSISKSMTGLCTAKLVEADLLEIDDSFYKYVPDFPKKNWDFSLKELAAHTSGIRHYTAPNKKAFWSEQFSNNHYDSLKKSIELFENDELLFQPGSNFKYSTHGFTLLGMALEKANGKDFISTMEENLWKPLSMVNTKPDDLTQNISNRAVPYTKILGRYVKNEGPDPSYKWAGGGILSTPSDLVIMGGAFANNSLIDSTLTEKLFTPVPLNDGSENPQKYALGWRNARSYEMLGTSDTLAIRHHGGSSPGGSSFLIVLPKDDVAAAAMTNLSLRDSWPLRGAMFKIAGLFREKLIH